MRNDIACVMFGVEREADVTAVEIESRGLEGTRFDLVTPRGRVKAFLPLPGRHNLYNALAAAGVADRYRIALEEIAAALAQIHPQKMRGEVLRFRDGFTIIDDSYNSNPRALLEMAATLCSNTRASRRIVVAGEMLELGAEGERLHHEAGRRIAELAVDKLIGVCGLASAIVAGAREAGMSADAAVFADTPEAAAEILIRDLRAGDLVLVKGSRGVKTEVIVERVKHQFERAADGGGSNRNEHREESLRQLA